MTSTQLDLTDLRSEFPSLAQTGADGRPFAFFDGPAGTQVPQRVIDAMTRYLLRANANVHGQFETSRRSQQTVDDARAAAAALLGGAPQEIAFGPNMTTLTFAVSRALGRTWASGDEVIVTRLDHDANIAPWMALQEQGIRVQHCDFDPDDCTLDLHHLASLINRRTRLVAVGHASNAVGTINPIAEIARLAHASGALVWVDAVHSAPHVGIDVARMGADFLVCSAYKFFGPHLGILWMRRVIGEQLAPYKVRPAPGSMPEKFESGTSNLEGLAGLIATIDYLSAIGRREDAVQEIRPAGGKQEATGPSAEPSTGPAIEPAVEPATGGGELPQSALRLDLRRALATIAAWEQPMAARLIAGLGEIPGVQIYGITDPDQLGRRCPTISFRLGIRSPSEVTARLGEQGIFAWDGNNYAVSVTDRLQVEATGGLVRVGIVHYNTPDEVERLLAAVREMA